MTWKCVNNRFYYFKILKLKKAHWDDFGHNSLYKKSFNQVRIVGLICIREVQPAIPVQLLTIYSGWTLINLNLWPLSANTPFEESQFWIRIIYKII